VVVNPKQVPDWYIASLDVVQYADGTLREVEIALRDFIETKDANVRVSVEMAKLLDALHGVIGRLALVEMTTRQLFEELASRNGPDAPKPAQSKGPRPMLRW
jgi:hypothetical protein